MSVGLMSPPSYSRVSSPGGGAAAAGVASRAANSVGAMTYRMRLMRLVQRMPSGSARKHHRSGQPSGNVAERLRTTKTGAGTKCGTDPGADRRPGAHTVGAINRLARTGNGNPINAAPGPAEQR